LRNKVPNIGQADIPLEDPKHIKPLEKVPKSELGEIEIKISQKPSELLEKYGSQRQAGLEGETDHKKPPRGKGKKKTSQDSEDSYVLVKKVSTKKTTTTTQHD